MFSKQNLRKISETTYVVFRANVPKDMTVVKLGYKEVCRGIPLMVEPTYEMIATVLLFHSEIVVDKMILMPSRGLSHFFFRVNGHFEAGELNFEMVFKKLKIISEIDYLSYFLCELRLLVQWAKHSKNSKIPHAQRNPS